MMYRPSNSVIERVRALFRKRVPTSELAFLGDSRLPGARVDVPGRPGYVYVRFPYGRDANGYSQFTKPTIARSGSAAYLNAPGSGVYVAWGDNNELEIKSAHYPSLDRAGINTSVLNPLNQQSKFVYTWQLTYGLANAVATAATSSALVTVKSFRHFVGNLFQTFDTPLEADKIDLSAYIPGTDEHCLAAIWIDTYTNTAEVTTSVVQDLDEPFDNTDIQELVADRPPDAMPLKAFILANGQVKVSQNPANETDLRQHMATPHIWGFPNILTTRERVRPDRTLVVGPYTTSGAGDLDLESGAQVIIVHKSNITNTAPTINDDSGDGYSIGSLWFDTSTGLLYVASDVTAGAAVWNEVESSATGGITQLTGDVTAGPGSGSQAATLATVNSNVGTFTYATVTVNGKGLVTAASSGAAPITSVTDNLNYLTTSTVSGAVTIDSSSLLVPAQVVATHPTNPSKAELRALDPAHIPFLDASIITSGTFAIARGGTGQSTKAAAYDALSPTTTEGDIEYRNATTNTRLPIGTANQQLRVNAGATAPEWFTPATPVTSVGGTAPIASSGGATPTISLNDTAVTPGSYTYGAFTVDQKGRLTSASSGLAPNIIAILRDEKTSGTNGGTSVTTTWNARDLNTELYDPDGIVSISSNQFTPIAGDYEILVFAPFFGGAAAQSGGRCRLYNVTGAAAVEEGISTFAATNANAIAILDCKFTANGTSAYRIDTYTSVGRATTGLGGAVADGSAEVYTCVLLRKVG